MKELITKLNALKIIQKSGDWAEDIPEDIWNSAFKGKFIPVAHNLNVDTHRWYETSIIVLKFKESFVGIRYLTKSFSESQDIEDCYVVLDFNEMEEVTIKSFKIK